MKDTLFLSKTLSEWTVEGGGRVVALGSEVLPQPTKPEPRRDSVSVERVGELGQRKIPSLRLTGSTIQQKNTTHEGFTEKQRYTENGQAEQ